MPATTTMTIANLLQASRDSEAGAMKIVRFDDDGEALWVVLAVTDPRTAGRVLAAVEAVEREQEQ